MTAMTASQSLADFEVIGLDASTGSLSGPVRASDDEDLSSVTSGVPCHTFTSDEEDETDADPLLKKGDGGECLDGSTILASSTAEVANLIASDVTLKLPRLNSNGALRDIEKLELSSRDSRAKLVRASTSRRVALTAMRALASLSLVLGLVWLAVQGVLASQSAASRSVDAGLAKVQLFELAQPAVILTSSTAIDQFDIRELVDDAGRKIPHDLSQTADSSKDLWILSWNEADVHGSPELRLNLGLSTGSTRTFTIERIVVPGTPALEHRLSDVLDKLPSIPGMLDGMRAAERGSIRHLKEAEQYVRARAEQLRESLTPFAMQVKRIEQSIAEKTQRVLDNRHETISNLVKGVDVVVADARRGYERLNTRLQKLQAETGRKRELSKRICFSI
ncbi:hypothetical protein PYCC9005_001193 [Savitreella phatthalungensis]